MRVGFLNLVAEWPLASTCTQAERRMIARATDYVHVRGGMIVSSVHEGLNPVVIVVHGELCVIAGNGLTRAGAGCVVGAAEVLARRPRAGQVVVAVSDADLLLIEPRRLLPLLQRCPNFAVELLRMLARDALAAAP